MLQCRVQGCCDRGGMMIINEINGRISKFGLFTIFLFVVNETVKDVRFKIVQCIEDEHNHTTK